VPTFLIRFDRPVDYLPDHPKGRRLGIRELLVHSDNLDQAKAHALRVTTGPGSVVEAGPLPPDYQPAIEAPEPTAPENLRYA
jgi:hypothetical protein